MSLFSNIFSSKPKFDLDIPDRWLPDAEVKRIHLHWTAGSWTASALDREHYHFLVEGDANVVNGKFGVETVKRPLREGRYAAHTRAANSDAIGVSMCAMAGATDRPLNAGRYPITKAQWNKTVYLIAALCRRYDVPVTSTTILTHAEVQVNLGAWQRGKWDVAFLPFWKNTVSAAAVGDKLRREVAQLV